MNPPPTRRWARSLATVATVINMVAESYRIDPVGAVLIRSFTNDVYRIETSNRRYALKIYGAHRFSTDEVRWEQQLVQHLLDAGVSLAPTVALRDGDLVGTLDAPEGQRPYALTEWLPGDKPQPPWTDDLYRRFGSLLAGVHQAADSFHSTLPRHSLRTGDEPERVIAVLDDDPVRQRLVRRCADAAREEVDRLAGRGLRWGIRHGDASLDNINISDQHLHLYDLDLAGPGWQVEDLTGALSTDFADAFLDGYTATRPIPAVDLEALGWLGILATIDNLAFHLIDKPATQGTWSLAEGWVEQGFEALARAAHQLGLQG
jgi:Ser/Thr protein kinase RdoA (MazF antagonist)